jgi:hypothetical protein
MCFAMSIPKPEIPPPPPPPAPVPVPSITKTQLPKKAVKPKLTGPVPRVMPEQNLNLGGLAIPTETSMG